MMKPLTVVRLLKVKAGGRLVYKASSWGIKDGRRRRLTETIGHVGTITRREAVLYCTTKQAAINSGRISGDRLDKVNLADFLAKDREAAAMDLKATSLRELRIAGNHATAALGEDFNVQKVGAAEVARIRHYLQDKGLAVPTVVKTLAYLQGAFRRGVDLGRIHENPFAKMKRPKFQTPRPKTFSPKEVAAMIDACPDEWWEGLIRLGATSGCRCGEMINLRWDSVDLDRSRVTIDPQKSGSFTVGKETYPLLAWESKSYETRTIPIPESTVAALRTLRAQAGNSPYVFLDLRRLRRIQRRLESHGELGANFDLATNLGRGFQAIQRRAKALLESQGDKVEWPHRSIKHLRSTYATTMSAAFTSFQLRGLMGHSSVITTEKHYVATSGDLGQQVQELFDGKESKALRA